jgi:hypothetical protein
MTPDRDDGPVQLGLSQMPDCQEFGAPASGATSPRKRCRPDAAAPNRKPLTISSLPHMPFQGGISRIEGGTLDVLLIARRCAG